MVSLDIDNPALRHRFDGIVHEIDHHAANLLWVDRYQRERRREPGTQINSSENATVEGEDVRQKRVNISRHSPR